MTVSIPRCDDAVSLLRSLGSPSGTLASASSLANYAAVFARDGVMAGLAGLILHDASITSVLVRTLEHLRDLQGTEGQIASNYAIRESGPSHVSFGTLVPRVDAALWYLIGIGLGARAGAVDPAPFADSVRRVVRLLNALEYNGRHLLYIPVGGNWADEYVYEGYVLHDQVLRAWALRLVGQVYDEPSWREKSHDIERTIASAFAPTDAGRPLPIAAYTPTRVYHNFDLATCALLGASGVAPSLAGPALGWIDETYLAHGTLPPAFDPVIDERHPDWAALCRYQLHGFRNRPHEYHNGGVWPIWLGWLALAMAATGRARELARLQVAVAAQLAAHPAFAFEEYFHGLTGVPSGTAQMAYSATGLIFLRAASDPRTLTLLAP